MSDESPPLPAAPPPLRIRLLELDPVVDAGAKAQGIDRSKWVRNAIRHYLAGHGAESAAAIEALAAELEKLRREFAPVGANLNQIARAFNTSGKLEFEALARNHFAMQEQFRAMAKLLRRISREIETSR